MIIRIQTGNSFKGAGLYYLHDKKREGEKERLTSERVAWTHTFNTLETAPDAALDEMRQTASTQQLLKHVSGNRLDGRPTELTVMTVALSWAEDQHPDQQQMIDGAQAYLKKMQWDAHQVLLVAHNDTAHRHVHLIVNRVHPETGMTLDANWAKTRSQRWALAYEKEQGRIYCEARASRYEHDQERLSAHLSRRDWRAWQEIVKENAFDPEYRRALEAGEWDALKEGQKQERIAFWKDMGQMRNQLRDALRVEVREQMAPQWRAYAEHRAQQMEKARLYDQEARRAIRHLRHEGHAQKTKMERVQSAVGRVHQKRVGKDTDGIEQIKERQKKYHDQLRDDLAILRASINASQKEAFVTLAGPVLARLTHDRQADYRALLERQREEKSELRQDQHAGQRRFDVLDALTPREGARLTTEQLRGYVHAARENHEVSETTIQRTDRNAVVASNPREAQAAPEIIDGLQEKRDKDQAQEAKRQAGLAWYREKRQKDRDRERDGNGGGRER